MDLTFEVRQYIRDNMRKATFMEMAELLKCDPYWLIDQLRPTPTVKRGRMWSPEDDMQLLSLFGQNDFETIAEQTEGIRRSCRDETWPYGRDVSQQVRAAHPRKRNYR